MKPRPPKHVVFYIEDWHRLKSNPKLAVVMNAIEPEALFCTVDKITRKSAAARGRPPDWSDDALAYLWAQIEKQRIAAGAKHVEPFINKLFAGSKRKRKPLIVHVNTATGKRLTVDEPGTARRKYVEAQKKIFDGPDGPFALACHRLLKIIAK